MHFKKEVNVFLCASRQRPPSAAQPRTKSTSSLVPCVSARPQLLSQGRSQRLHWCLASVPALSCSAKDEVNVFIGALRQRPPSAAQPRTKSTSSLVPCVSARPQLLSQGRSQRLHWCLASVPALSCSAKDEVNVFIGALRQCPPSAAQPRTKSTSSLVPCVSARPQLLSQGRRQRLNWCLASAPALSCSAKGEDNVLIGALRQRPPSAAQPRTKTTSSLVPCVSARPQLLSQGRRLRLPWCLASAPAISCSAK